MRIFNTKVRSGFTLVELLLSVALIGVVSVVSFPITQSFLYQNELIDASNAIVNLSRSAQLKSSAGEDDSVWGISIQSQKVILFDGTSYAGRDTNADEIFIIPAGISLSGVSEFTFSKLHGEPSTTGNIILTNRANQTKTLAK